jgi:hypothetical protein
LTIGKIPKNGETGRISPAKTGRISPAKQA